MKRLFLVLLFFATAAHGETYKRTDKDGAVHFSDSRPSVSASTAVSVADAKAGTDAVGIGDNGALGEQVEGLKERMMNDGGIMSLITALQSDPDMQAILNDPAVMKAIQSGDIATLMQNPSFMKLLDNPRVQEIQKKLQNGGAR